jgi:hypothetical protein
VSALWVLAVLAADGGAHAADEAIARMLAESSAVLTVDAPEKEGEVAVPEKLRAGQYVELDVSMWTRKGHREASAKVRVTVRDAGKRIVRVDGLGAPFELTLPRGAKAVRGNLAHGTVAGVEFTGVCERASMSDLSAIGCFSADERIAPTGGWIGTNAATQGERFSAKLSALGQATVPAAISAVAPAEEKLAEVVHQRMEALASVDPDAKNEELLRRAIADSGCQRHLHRGARGTISIALHADGTMSVTVEPNELPLATCVLDALKRAGASGSELKLSVVLPGP